MKDTTTILTLILFVAFLVIIGPILTIWALNTLFPALAIPYALETWFAIVILGFTLKSNVTVKK
jgi:hypothetical protein